MKNTSSMITLLIATLAISAAVVAQEHKIERSQLPLAVQKTVDAKSQGATIRGFSKEVEHGKISYEVALTVDGHSRDVQIDSEGNVTEVEEEVRVAELPTEVKAGLKEKAGAGTIIKVESLRKRDKIVAYEAQVMTGGKKSEIQVGSDGKPLDHEE